MQVKERFCQFIRLLTDSKPKGITDEEWKVIRDEREAKKRKQAELERYAIDHFEETPEYPPSVSRGKCFSCTCPEKWFLRAYAV